MFHCTGTGNTGTIIGQMYRPLTAERFRRIPFLVDRTALGKQAQKALAEPILDQNQPLSKSYNVAELDAVAAEAESRALVPDPPGRMSV